MKTSYKPRFRTNIPTVIELRFTSGYLFIVNGHCPFIITITYNQYKNLIYNSVVVYDYINK
jgi:hypothetical protein